MPYIQDSDLHGHGVFADKDYAQDDTIELCPYLFVSEDEVADECILHNYMFQSAYEGDTDFMVVLGLGMVYNHGDPPNAEWEIEDDDERFVRFFALKEIKQGEEILHDYGKQYWESRDASITIGF